MTFKFRDYQIDAIARIFAIFGVEPAGPPVDQVVLACRSHRAGENCDDGGAGEPLAERQGDADKPPF